MGDEWVEGPARRTASLLADRRTRHTGGAVARRIFNLAEQVRHSSGWVSICCTLNATGCPVSAASLRIQTVS